jgi:hypothetical protein
MNVLAEEQKKLLEKGLSKEEFKKREERFFKLYYELRKKDEGRFWNKLSLKQRKSIHWLILNIYKIKNKLGGFQCDLLKDERTKTNRPLIFAITHVGKYDIEVVSEAIKDHYYLLSGDFEHIQGIIDAPFLGINGVLYFNEMVKEDRALVSKKMVELLNKGGNIMYFIEGTWNLTPNLPLIPCYWGIVDVAKKGKAMVVPVAAEQYGKTFKVNIGKNFDMNLYGDTLEEKTKAITDLKDTLATLKWEIWESMPLQKEKN